MAAMFGNVSHTQYNMKSSEPWCVLSPRWSLGAQELPPRASVETSISLLVRAGFFSPDFSEDVSSVSLHVTYLWPEFIHSGVLMWSKNSTEHTCSVGRALPAARVKQVLSGQLLTCFR